MSALQLAVETHVNARREALTGDTTGACPLDPAVFQALQPMPEGLQALVGQLTALNSRLTFEAYRGRFEDLDEPRLVLCAETPGEVGFLVVLDQAITPLCCARREVDHLFWISFDELLSELKTA